MIVALSADGTLTLEAPDTFTAFHLRSPGQPMDWIVTTLGPTAKAAHAGHIWLSIQCLHDLGDKHGGPHWRQGCDKMLAYAETKGWLDEERRFVLAHVEQQATS